MSAFVSGAVLESPVKILKPQDPIVVRIGNIQVRRAAAVVDGHGRIRKIAGAERARELKFAAFNQVGRRLVFK